MLWIEVLTHITKGVQMPTQVCQWRCEVCENLYDSEHQADQCEALGEVTYLFELGQVGKYFIYERTIRKVKGRRGEFASRHMAFITYQDQEFPFPGKQKAL